MVLPKKLYNSYKQVSKSRLVAGNTSDDAITEF